MFALFIFSLLGTSIASDWLLTPQGPSKAIVPSNIGGNVTLTNGIVTRDWMFDHKSGTLYTASIRTSLEEKLRSPVAEAAMIVNDHLVYVGGTSNSTGTPGLRMQYVHPPRQSHPRKRFNFTVGDRASRPNVAWPPLGARLEFDHMLPCASIGAGSGSINVTVAMEIFDNTAAFGKRLHINHNCSELLYVYNMTVDMLQLEQDGLIEMSNDPAIARAAIGNIDSDQNVWITQYDVVAPYKLEMLGPGLSKFSSSDNFQTFTVIETVHDARRSNTFGMSRFGLETARTSRTVSPQIASVPVTVSLVCTGGHSLPPTDPRVGYYCYDEEGTASAKNMIKQAAEVGAELVMFVQNMNETWRSTVGVEFQTQENITWMKDIVDYGKGLGLQVGLYQLLKNARSASAYNQAAPNNAEILPRAWWDVMDAPPPLGTGETCHEHAGCKGGGSGCCALCASNDFYDEMEATMLEFWDKTGILAVDQDGAESAQACANESHKGHHGVNDSLTTQWERVQTTFHRYLNRGGFIHGMPGHFIDGGQSKVPGGYDEMTFSLPRWRWIHRQRQRMIADPQGRDQTMPNAMRFMITPFVPYHPSEVEGDCWIPPCKFKPVSGYESSATLEPLDEHLVELEWALSNTYGTGVITNLRGYRMYQSNASKAIVVKWISFFKKYRQILVADFTTLNWSNETGYDAVLHWAPEGYYPDIKERGLIVVWNTLNTSMTYSMAAPLYFSGLTTSALVREKEGTPKLYSLDANFTTNITVVMEPLAITYFVIEAPSL
eukprot:m.37766 g.37766  ORF g.37766 m.37766 type:complete len:774 (-) comp9349_c0_seq2:28-2349(-)